MVLFLMTLGAFLGLVIGSASVISMGASLWTGFCIYLGVSLLGVSIGVILSMFDDRGRPNAPGTRQALQPKFA